MICTGTESVVITPDMEAIQPVANFVRCVASHVGRGPRRPNGPKADEIDDYTVSGSWPSRELCVAIQARPQIADPDIEVSITGPCVRTACANRLHSGIRFIARTILGECCDWCLGA